MQKLIFIPEKLTVRTGNNCHQHPKLKPLLILEQSLRLRLSGSGVAPMSTPCRYPTHNILFYPYVCWVSWLIPICSGWWGFIHISSLILGSWRTEQPSPEYLPVSLFRFILRIFAQVWLRFPEGTLHLSWCMILTMVEIWPTSSYSMANLWSFG